ncbi:hypothetical protein M569_10851 [Genlisea aurea]|uniref:ABC transporter domain-containing protein n=1 Tax=Genlisea aurea TaxID=192259 RepID=S8CAJ6_9LAMI|nr:hypothetical protein M569_10851 [Genlisea aurea]
MPPSSVAPKPGPGSSETGAVQPDELPAFTALTGSNSIVQRTLFPVTLKFEDIGCKVGSKSDSVLKQKTILNGITGTVSPGEVLAMLGPSGSGKTTLLTALGGRLAGKLSGRITYNGEPFSGTIRRKTGFVSQDDVLYQHLTVFETLLFTALLRLPDSLKEHDKVRHVESVIAELGLTKCRSSMIGGPLLRGISGGEKKRVSIGQEMLINPSLLLLDEPTSGLDSTTAQRIMNTIRGLAGGGRTIVTTIHQPSSRVYQMFDKVVLLSEGRPIYYGSGSGAMEYFSSIGFSPSIPINPADLLLDLANGVAPDYCEKKTEDVREYLLAAYEKNIWSKAKTEVRSSETINDTSGGGGLKHRRGEKWSTSWWNEFCILIARGLRERRFEAFNKLRIFQVLSVAILGGLLWWQTPPSHIDDRIAMIFFYSVFWGFYPLYNAVFTFPQDRAILRKEKSSSMYRLSSYFLARTVADLPLDLALPAAFTVVFYFMGGLTPRPLPFLLSLLNILLAVLVSQGLGLLFGALLMDVKQAATLASVTTLVFLIAGGYYVRRIPPFIGWIRYLSFSYYSYRMLLGVQYGEGDVYECGGGGGGTSYCRVADFPAVKAVGLGGLWVDAAAMVAMLVGYRVLAYFALRRAL